MSDQGNSSNISLGPGLEASVVVRKYLLRYKLGGFENMFAVFTLDKRRFIIQACL